MKHVGPLKPNHPFRSYWRDVMFTFAGAGGWMMLNSFANVGLADQMIILAMLTIVIPSVVIVARTLSEWWSAASLPMPGCGNDIPIGLDALWPMGTVWIVEDPSEPRTPRPWPASRVSIPPDVRRRLRKDVE